MKTYHGVNHHTVIVEETGIGEGISYLDPRRSLKLRNHSPTGFSWSYCGSGPAQLALALLLDVTQNEELALEHYQTFKFDQVSGWKDSWRVTEDEIIEWLRRGNALIKTPPLYAIFSCSNASFPDILVKCNDYEQAVSLTEKTLKEEFADGGALYIKRAILTDRGELLRYETFAKFIRITEDNIKEFKEPGFDSILLA